MASVPGRQKRPLDRPVVFHTLGVRLPPLRQFGHRPVPGLRTASMTASHYVPNTKIPTLVFDTSGQAARHLALLVENLIRQNNSAGRATVLGLPTGSTPVGLYRELIRLHKEGLD